MADLAAEKGMKVACHHHMGTGVQTMAKIHRFMANVKDNVYLLYDSGHIYYSEGTIDSCAELLKKYKRRIAHIHLKDIRPEIFNQVRENKLSFLDGVRVGGFTVLGDGCIDFKALFKILEDNDYEGWMIVEAEQDLSKANPFEYALIVKKYIKEKSGL